MSVRRNGICSLTVRFLPSLLLLSVCSWAQENRAPSDPRKALPARAEEIDSSAEAKPLTPREKAKELLESAAEVVAAASPEVHVMGLVHLADNFREFDQGKSVKYLHDAFAAVEAVPENGKRRHKARLRYEVVRKMADLNVEEATNYLGRMQSPAGGFDFRTLAVGQIVQTLAANQNYDRAISVIEGFAPDAPYPYRAVSGILNKLPTEDPRRIVLLGNAMASFPGRPGYEFAELVALHWRSVPSQMASSAVQMIVSHVLDQKVQKDTVETTTLSSAKGSVHFSSKEEFELFRVMHILRELVPKKAEEILERRPELRAAIERFPGGVESLKNENGSGIHTGTYRGNLDPQGEGRRRLHALALTRAAEARTHLPDEPDEALSKVEHVPVPSIRAKLLAEIARSVSQGEPKRARSVLGRCRTLLDELENPSDKIDTWDVLIETAHRMGDEPRAWEFAGFAMADATELYRIDTHKKRPNQALREFWPSTQGFRRIIDRSTKLFGVEAEPLLAKISEPDLALLARIEMAQALLGRNATPRNISVSRGN